MVIHEPEGGPCPASMVSLESLSQQLGGRLSAKALLAFCRNGVIIGNQSTHLRYWKSPRPGTTPEIRSDDEQWTIFLLEMRRLWAETAGNSEELQVARRMYAGNFNPLAIHISD